MGLPLEKFQAALARILQVLLSLILNFMVCIGCHLFASFDLKNKKLVHLVLIENFRFLLKFGAKFQGSAHTGPALTPAEVLVAIHGINPEKDGVALKKVILYLYNLFSMFKLIF